MPQHETYDGSGVVEAYHGNDADGQADDKGIGVLVRRCPRLRLLHHRGRGCPRAGPLDIEIYGQTDEWQAPFLTEVAALVECQQEDESGKGDDDGRNLSFDEEE